MGGMTEIVHRHPRVRPAAPERTEFDLPAPPVLEPPPKLQAVQLLVPVLGSMSILVYGVMARTAVLLVTGGIMALASLASPLVLHWTGRRAQRTKQAQRRERYRAVLAALNEEVARGEGPAGGARRRRPPRTRRARGLARRPAPVGRRLDDEDVLDVAIGAADVATGFTVRRHGTPSVDADQDEELLAEVASAGASAASLPGAPLVLRLADAGVVAVTGDRAGSLALVRAALLELVLTCAPDDLCLVPPSRPRRSTRGRGWRRCRTPPPSPPAGAAARTSGWSRRGRRSSSGTSMPSSGRGCDCWTSAPGQPHGRRSPALVASLTGTTR